MNIKWMEGKICNRERNKNYLFYVVIDIGHIKQSSSKYEQYLLIFITFSISNFQLFSCHVYISNAIHLFQCVYVYALALETDSQLAKCVLVSIIWIQLHNAKVHMAVEEDKYLWFVLLLCGLRGDTENNVSDSCNVWGIINISKHQCLIYHSAHTRERYRMLLICHQCV